jgi:outer membrane immunogenic protein
MAMRSILLAGVAAAVAIAGPAVAADMAATPVYKAPAPAVLPATWTGFYLGGHLGSGWGTKETYSTGDFDPFAGKAIGSSSVSGPLGGFQAGFNYQINWVVVGIDGDFSFANVKGSNIVGTDFLEGGITVKSPWFATLTGRIGGTVDHALLYVKGGVAWTQDEFGTTCGTFCAVSIPARQSRTGWTFGGGVEYAFTPDWSGKLEYDFMDFGTRGSGTFQCSGACEDFFDFDLRQQVSVVKVGLNYRLGWGRSR